MVLLQEPVRGDFWILFRAVNNRPVRHRAVCAHAVAGSVWGAVPVVLSPQQLLPWLCTLEQPVVRQQHTVAERCQCEVGYRVPTSDCGAAVRHAHQRCCDDAVVLL